MLGLRLLAADTGDTAFPSERDLQGLTYDQHWDKIGKLTEVINTHVERGDVIAVHGGPNDKAFFAEGLSHFTIIRFRRGMSPTFQQCAVRLPDPNGKVDFILGDQMTDTDYLKNCLLAYRTFKLICPDPSVPESTRARSQFAKQR